MANLLISVWSSQVNHQRSNVLTGHYYFLLLGTPNIHITAFPILQTDWRKKRTQGMNVLITTA